jgi:hypothetical protein
VQQYLPSTIIYSSNIFAKHGQKFKTGMKDNHEAISPWLFLYNIIIILQYFVKVYFVSWRNKMEKGDLMGSRGIKFLNFKLEFIVKERFISGQNPC